jgi:hypothetical protein
MQLLQKVQWQSISIKKPVCSVGKGRPLADNSAD